MTTHALDNMLNKLRQKRQETASLLVQAHAVLTVKVPTPKAPLPRMLAEASEASTADAPELDSPSLRQIKAEAEAIMRDMAEVSLAFEAIAKQADEELPRLTARLWQLVLDYTEQVQRYDLAIDILEKQGVLGWECAKKALDLTVPLPASAQTLQ